jgi:hypothetical protein
MEKCGDEGLTLAAAADGVLAVRAIEERSIVYRITR